MLVGRSSFQVLDAVSNLTINPTGGVLGSGADGLRIYVTNLGQMQVLYQNQNQFYNQTINDTSTNLFNGLYLAVGSQVVGPDHGAEVDLFGNILTAIGLRKAKPTA